MVQKISTKSAFVLMALVVAATAVPATIDGSDSLMARAKFTSSSGASTGGMSHTLSSSSSRPSSTTSSAQSSPSSSSSSPSPSEFDDSLENEPSTLSSHSGSKGNWKKKSRLIHQICEAHKAKANGGMGSNDPMDTSEASDSSSMVRRVKSKAGTTGAETSSGSSVVSDSDLPVDGSSGPSGSSGNDDINDLLDQICQRKGHGHGSDGSWSPSDSSIGSSPPIMSPDDPIMTGKPNDDPEMSIESPDSSSRSANSSESSDTRSSESFASSGSGADRRRRLALRRK